MLDTDLVKTVAVWSRPIDEPLPHMLADTRRLQTKAVSDNMWVRLVDVPVALATRRYASPGRLVLDVRDPFCPWNTGRYAFEGGHDGATCTPTSEEPDLVMSSTELAALYLGGHRASTLAHAGRIDEERAGALDRADLVFLGSPAPFCSRDF
jgi:predicted acetyltransferase